MKLRLLIILMMLIVVGAAPALNNNRNSSQEERACAFCDEKILKRQTIYQDEIALVLYTHKPVMAGHCLIIPKRHVERFEELTEDESSHLCDLVKKVHRAVSPAFETSSYLLLQKNGREAGQSVPHVHIHYIPRPAGDGSALKFIAKLFWVNFKKPIGEDQIQQAIEKIKMHFII